MEQSSIISLNVGGHLFSTTPSTLSSRSPSLLSSYIQGDTNVSSSIHTLPDGTIFIDRDGSLFSIILNFLRNGRLCVSESFGDLSRLREEALFYQLPSLVNLIPSPSENGGGYVTLGYRGTFAYGRDGQADVKFRKLQRILVHGKASLCKEVFGDTLNESRDPGDHDFSDRYTTRLYLKHQCLEKACDAMADKGFKLVSTCTSGANGLSSHQLMSSGLSPGGQNVSHLSYSSF
ncbi:hypothetical protein PRIPAC_88432 [Pristionchus pacificus]|uniref:BTB domain-containing protein n=1 Tax=Pristionchus pacificus TaxID=54126 RepID=A0A2A6CIS1_PRIPA|nr:hypothetical protein PRIPAC_88432 [Pristionchus pacificus]|eukprot:PDM78115.1 hypothetical protein PRIPAC_30500 [Pristionchus pacificus]